MKWVRARLLNLFWDCPTPHIPIPYQNFPPAHNKYCVGRKRSIVPNETFNITRGNGTIGPLITITMVMCSRDKPRFESDNNWSGTGKWRVGIQQRFKLLEDQGTTQYSPPVRSDKSQQISTSKFWSQYFTSVKKNAYLSLWEVTLFLTIFGVVKTGSSIRSPILVENF